MLLEAAGVEYKMLALNFKMLLCFAKTLELGRDDILEFPPDNKLFCCWMLFKNGKIFL